MPQPQTKQIQKENKHVIYVKQKVHQHLPQYKIQNINIKALSGLTNLTFKVECEEQKPLVFRIFSDIYDRNIQNQVFKILQERKIAPKCIFACENYRIEMFIQNALHPSLKSLEQKSVKKEILQLMYKYHQTKIQILQDKPLFIEYILSQQFVNKVKNHLKDKQSELFSKLCTLVINQFNNLEKLKDKYLQKNKEQILKRKKFCHNDLNNLNIFLEPKLYFIDYQYSSYNYLSFDIANFLNESTIDYTVEQYPCFKQLRHLSSQEILETAKLYPGYYQGLEAQIIQGLCICNLYWASWSIMMAAQPSNQNFGTVQHGLMRVQLYQFYQKML